VRLQIAHQGQVDEVLDRAVSEPLPYLLIFLSDILIRGVGRPFNAKVPEILKTNGDCTLELIQGYIKVDTQAGDSGPIDEFCGVLGEHRESLFGRCQIARQELGLGAV